MQSNDETQKKIKLWYLQDREAIEHTIANTADFGDCDVHELFDSKLFRLITRVSWTYGADRAVEISDERVNEVIAVCIKRRVVSHLLIFLGGVSTGVALAMQYL